MTKPKKYSTWLIQDEYWREVHMEAGVPLWVRALVEGSVSEHGEEDV